jgi:uncharacterized protein YdeI (YjbR/CyaY-like superfamily)
MTDQEIRDFHKPESFRAWLRKHHAGRSELVLRLYKTHAADRGITYAQALDEALCFGWIDGVRRGLDNDSFTTRFSPRRPKSIWSLVNLARVKRLVREGRMTKPGLAVFQARDQKRSGLYSFENRPSRLSQPLGRMFRANQTAWEFFQAQAPWYRRTSIFWVMSAKRKETRETRLSTLIACSKDGKPIPALARQRKGEGKA